MAQKNSKNDIAWNKIQEHFNFLGEIEQNGLFTISSEEINTIGEREARLMTKFDFISQQPKIFNDNGLSILPLTRGSYVVAKMNLYERFIENPDVPIETISLPNEIASLNLSTITSEAHALAAAESSILFNDFLGEQTLYSTVNGRMGSGVFDYNVNANGFNLELRADECQIEIDGSQECGNFLALIEAKNRIHPEFMIRQMYFPMRTWSSIVHKPIRNIFLQYSNGEFYVREYAFEDPLVYNSLQLVKEKKYRLIDNADITITSVAVMSYANRAVLRPAPENVPFPQCDEFRRIIYLLELFHENEDIEWTKEDLGQNMNFGSIDPRQKDYYLNGALYLGFIQSRKENRTQFYRLSPLGLRIMSIDKPNERKFEIIKSMLQLQVINVLVKNAIETHNLSLEHVKAYLRKTVPLSTDGMYHRRGQTIKAWIGWILDQIQN